MNLFPLRRWPAATGAALALLAAVLFGASTPLIQLAAAGLGSFSTAALLYAGAAIVGWCSRRSPTRERTLSRADLPRLVSIAVFGAALGPVAFAWGLQHTSGTGASLMLALEAVFTALLAWLLCREPMNRRTLAAMAALLLGGVLLIVDRAQVTRGAPLLGSLAGLAAVGLATLAWSVDNVLSRPLAERDPGRVVAGKAALGTVMTAPLAVWNGEPMPTWAAAALLAAIGATGYGLSLRCYLLAQRRFGAARTGSVFALAPFIGAALAFAIGERDVGVLFPAAAVMMLAGVLLHATETHAHEHVHEEIVHEHAHTHDDAHHTHTHDPMPVGAHSHRHRHEPIRHSHPHVPDAHHDHAHD